MDKKIWLVCIIVIQSFHLCYSSLESFQDHFDNAVQRFEDSDSLCVDLLQQHPEYNTSPNSWGLLPLHHAVMWDRTALIGKMLQCRICVDQENVKGETPLWVALCYNNHTANVDILCKHGADINYINKYGQNVFQVWLGLDDRGQTPNLKLSVLQKLFQYGFKCVPSNMSPAECENNRLAMVSFLQQILGQRRYRSACPILLNPYKPYEQHDNSMVQTNCAFYQAHKKLLRGDHSDFLSLLFGMSQFGDVGYQLMAGRIVSLWKPESIQPTLELLKLLSFDKGDQAMNKEVMDCLTKYQEYCAVADNEY